MSTSMLTDLVALYPHSKPEDLRYINTLVVSEKGGKIRYAICEYGNQGVFVYRVEQVGSVKVYHHLQEHGNYERNLSFDNLRLVEQLLAKEYIGKALTHKRSFVNPVREAVHAYQHWKIEAITGFTPYTKNQPSLFDCCVRNTSNLGNRAESMATDMMLIQLTAYEISFEDEKLC